MKSNINNVILITCLLSCCQSLLLAQDQLVISDGGSLIMTGGNLHLIDSDFINNGTFSATAGTVYMRGTDVNLSTIIEGTSDISFHSLLINKDGQYLALNREIRVKNNLTLSNGLLDIKNHDIQVDGSILNASANSYVWTSGTGRLLMDVGGSNTVFPVGVGTFSIGSPVNKVSYLPLILNNAGTTDKMGVRVEDIVRYEATSGSAITDMVVNATWHVDENVAGGSDLTVTATWNTADELSMFNRNACYISQYTTSGNWDVAPTNAAAGTDPYTRSRQNIPAATSFAVTSAVTLPLELLSFKATKRGETALLNWITEEEENSSHFEVERSLDDTNFKQIGKVDAKGTPDGSSAEYDFVDTNPLPGTNYYRLKIVDMDDSHDYSPTRALTFDRKKFYVGDIFPNPSSNGSGQLLVVMNESSEVNMDIFDAAGKLVLSSTTQLPEGESFLNIQTPSVGSQVYMIRLIFEDRSIHNRLFSISK